MTITIKFLDGSTDVTTSTTQDMTTILNNVLNNAFVNFDTLILRTNNIAEIIATPQ